MKGDAAAVRSSFCLVVIVAALLEFVQAGPVSIYSASKLLSSGTSFGIEIVFFLFALIGI